MASSSWSAEDGTRAYSQRADRQKRREDAIRPVRAAKAAGRDRRSV